MKSPRQSKASRSGSRKGPRNASPAPRPAAPGAFEQRFALRREREERLFAAIQERLPALEKLLTESNGHWSYEDLVYRFYHQSFKVYRAQEHTERIVAALRSLLPDVLLNESFTQIVTEGTGRSFQHEDNARWLEVTRPMLEAFFHAKYFLEMVCRYGRELKEPPEILPSGWASVLYLYGLR